jgi:hypothetical protein
LEDVLEESPESGLQVGVAADVLREDDLAQGLDVKPEFAALEAIDRGRLPVFHYILI